MINTIKVRFQVEGWHCWPEAPEPRKYLRYSHRHMFHWQVEMGVGHHNREVEFHDLLDQAKNLAPSGDMGRMSCEDMAAGVVKELDKIYPNRKIAIEVWEDGEVGSLVSIEPLSC